MDHTDLLDHVVEALQGVEGVTGVVLGGSRANGTHTPASDFDVGVFYRGRNGFDLAALERVASLLDDDGRPNLVTPIGGWGPWMVGGGWLKIRSQAVDLIYRDVERVAAVIADCRNGVIDVCQQPGYVVGFVTATYMAEIDACRLLWDASGELAALKALTRPYPPSLERAIFERFRWVPAFAIAAGRKCIARADVAFASSCVYWATTALCQMLLARNGQYCLHDKGSVARVDVLPMRPRDFRSRVEGVFSSLRAESGAISAAFDELESVVKDFEALQ